MTPAMRGRIKEVQDLKKKGMINYHTAYLKTLTVLEDYHLLENRVIVEIDNLVQGCKEQDLERVCANAFNKLVTYFIPKEITNGSHSRRSGN